MTTETQKSIVDLERRVAGIQVDYDFYSTGFPYTSVEAKSANHIYGNGKWKKTIIDALGEDIFKANCDKFTNGNSTKAIDFKIACFKTKHAPYFKINETINVKDNNNLYSGTFKVIESSDEGVCVLVPYKGNSTGKLINQSRKNGTEGSLKRHLQMLSDIKPTETKIAEETKAPLGVGATTSYSNILPGEPTPEDIAKKIDEQIKRDKNKKTIKTVLTIGTIVLIIIGAYIAYKKFKTNK